MPSKPDFLRRFNWFADMGGIHSPIQMLLPCLLDCFFSCLSTTTHNIQTHKKIGWGGDNDDEGNQKEQHTIPIESGMDFSVFSQRTMAEKLDMAIFDTCPLQWIRLCLAIVRVQNPRPVHYDYSPSLSIHLYWCFAQDIVWLLGFKLDPLCRPSAYSTIPCS
jgi:hypothetical protein